MSDTQAPAQADYRRAAALMIHQFRGDMEGWNEVMREADELDRLSAMVIAVVEMAGHAPEPLATAPGMAGLQAVAQGMALDDTSQ